MRRVISHNFTPRVIARLEDQLRGYARLCLDEAAEKGHVDFVGDIAHRVPAAIAFALMGIPEDRWDRLAELEHLTVSASDPEFTHGKAAHEAAAEASMELFTYLAELVHQRMAAPGDDLLSQLVLGQVDGEKLPWQQVVAEAGLLLAGGLDTTPAAASAGAMLPLIERPDQLRALQDDMALLPTAVEEFLRWASPITSEARTVTRDVELNGQQLHDGDRVVMWSPSCNRDDAHFDDPFRFDIRRQPNRHLSFAHGEHYCLGVHLARLTLKVEFDELLRRFRSFELDGQPSRCPFQLRGRTEAPPGRPDPPIDIGRPRPSTPTQSDTTAKSSRREPEPSVRFGHGGSERATTAVTPSVASLMVMVVRWTDVARYQAMGLAERK